MGCGASSSPEVTSSQKVESTSTTSGKAKLGETGKTDSTYVDDIDYENTNVVLWAKLRAERIKKEDAISPDKKIDVSRKLKLSLERRPSMVDLQTKGILKGSDSFDRSDVSKKLEKLLGEQRTPIETLEEKNILESPITYAQKRLRRDSTIAMLKKHIQDKGYSSSSDGEDQRYQEAKNRRGFTRSYSNLQQMLMDSSETPHSRFHVIALLTVAVPRPRIRNSGSFYRTGSFGYGVPSSNMFGVGMGVGMGIGMPPYY